MPSSFDFDSVLEGASAAAGPAATLLPRRLLPVLPGAALLRLLALASLGSPVVAEPIVASTLAHSHADQPPCGR